MIGELYPGEFEAMEHNGRMDALEQEPCDVFDEYGNYKYPSDVELTEPNTATSMPCEDAIRCSDMLDAIGHGTTYTSEELQKIIKALPSVNPLSKDYNTIYYTPQPKTGHWIPVSERLPEDFGLYLITLENGDVCQCEFNPDFIDEEHENGAFTYYHQYFDGATLGMIDEEEEAVDAIAWMPFEPYEPQESEEA